MNVIGVTESLPITHYPGHAHGDFEMVFVAKGRMTILAGGERFHVAEGDILVLPPHTDHEGVDGEDFVNIFLHAKNMEFSDIQSVHDNDGSVRSLFVLLKRLMNEKEVGYGEISDKLLEVVSAYVKKYSKQTFRYDFVRKIKNLIYENLSNPDFRVSDEVRRMGYHPDYFRRCFSEELGQTPQEYLTRLRLEHAKGLLTQRNPIRVEAVAEQCGFSDSFYFSKVFKKHTGLSPSEYRKTYGE